MKLGDYLMCHADDKHYSTNKTVSEKSSTFKESFKIEISETWQPCMTFFPWQLFLMNHNNFTDVHSSFYCIKGEPGALLLVGIIINDDELQRNKEK